MMRSAFTALLAGWLLSVWIPVPSIVFNTMSATASAISNGVKAISTALHPPPPGAQAKAG